MLAMGTTCAFFFHLPPLLLIGSRSSFSFHSVGTREHGRVRERDVNLRLPLLHIVLEFQKLHVGQKVALSVVDLLVFTFGFTFGISQLAFSAGHTFESVVFEQRRKCRHHLVIFVTGR